MHRWAGAAAQILASMGERMAPELSTERAARGASQRIFLDWFPQKLAGCQTGQRFASSEHMAEVPPMASQERLVNKH